MYSQNLRTEIQKDPSLQGLRGEFAKFCLGRLRTKGKPKDSGYTNKDFIEPRPVWRGCYVQALKVLGVNPGGRARRTLFWLSKNDPDKGVREYAKRVHSQVRHLDQEEPNLDKGASHVDHCLRRSGGFGSTSHHARYKRLMMPAQCELGGQSCTGHGER